MDGYVETRIRESKLPPGWRFVRAAHKAEPVQQRTGGRHRVREKDAHTPHARAHTTTRTTTTKSTTNTQKTRTHTFVKHTARSDA